MKALKTLGDEMKYQREMVVGISQKTAIERAEVGRTTYQQVEHGDPAVLNRRRPELTRMSRAVEMPDGWLVERIEEIKADADRRETESVRRLVAEAEARDQAAEDPRTRSPRSRPARRADAGAAKRGRR